MRLIPARRAASDLEIPARSRSLRIAAGKKAGS